MVNRKYQKFYCIRDYNCFQEINLIYYEILNDLQLAHFRLLRRKNKCFLKLSINNKLKWRYIVQVSNIEPVLHRFDSWCTLSAPPSKIYNLNDLLNISGQKANCNVDFDIKNTNQMAITILLLLWHMQYYVIHISSLSLARHKPWWDSEHMS